MPGVFCLKAEGGATRPPEVVAVRAALSILVAPEFSVEICKLPGRHGRAFLGSDLDGMVKLVEEFNEDSKGIYLTINPLRQGLSLALGQATKDKDVFARQWFLIDVDPIRPPDTNATEEEREKAREVMYTIMTHLDERAWPEPLVISSGNGWGLLYKVDLLNDEITKALFRNATKELAKQFATKETEIDLKVTNAARIYKIPGTWARKGPDTPDRPHRLATIVHCPEVFETVPLEKFQEFGKPYVPPPKPSVFAVKAHKDGGRGYAQAALRKEIAKIHASPVGARNNTFNTACFSVGTLVGAGAILEQEAENALCQAARSIGLPDHEIRSTLKSGMEAGKAQPRTIPERNGKKAAPPPVEIPEGESVIVWGKDIKPKRLNWLWPGMITVGKLTTFAGQTGQGKTFVTCDIISRVSQGLAWPNLNGECPKMGKALFISGDDDADDTIVPRLIEAGADMSRVAFFTEAAQEHWTLAALETLNKALEQMGDDVSIVVIDPPTSFMGAINDHNNSELRSVLTPLKSWASKNKVAMILITHVNKAGGKGIEALARVIGGVGWVTAVRAAFMFLPDPEDGTKQLFLPLKMNLGPKPKGLAYRVAGRDGTEQAHVDWLGEVDMTANEAMGSFPRKEKREVVAAQWLIGQFRKQLAWPSKDLFEAAKNEGISRSAVWEAEKVLQLPPKRQEYDESGERFWVWHVPADWHYFKDAKHRNTETVTDNQVCNELERKDF